MLATLRDLYAHQSWADAQHWAAILGCPAASASAELKERLVHLHGAQQSWLARWRGTRITFPEAERFPVLADLHRFARQVHADLDAFAAGLDAAALAALVHYTDPRGQAQAQPLGELMLHVALHSHYHRGQNASLLKKLGTPIPATDFVVWLRAGRPAAGWVS